MQREYLITLKEVCETHNIEISFINSLHQTGLIEITTIKETGFLDATELQKLEKFIRLYYDLDINLEGIETINYLLQRINNLQNEIVSLKNTLRLYEISE